MDVTFFPYHRDTCPLAEIEMKQNLIIILFLHVSFMCFGQKTKPSIKYWSQNLCKFPRQKGRFEVIKNDSIKLTTYKTDSSEMIMYADNFIGFLTDWNKKEHAEQIYLQFDTIVTLLFQNGLLTPELLVKSYNIGTTFIDEKGDTVNYMRVQTKTVQLLNIKRKELPYNYNNKETTIRYEVWVTFNPDESGWGSFPIFDLYLQSEVKPSKNNISYFLKKAKINCLTYRTTQI